jgi:hypothetical protein
MSLPSSVRVKISSEAAGAISITQVVAREMPFAELIERMLGVTGKDAARVHDLLLRGTLVSGASRLRWDGWDADAESLREILATFPDAEPQRPFARQRCVRATLGGGGVRIDIPREVGIKKRLLRRTSFWEVAMEAASGGDPQYVEYSYRDRADCYRVRLSQEAAARLRQNASLLGYSSLEAQIRAARLEVADLYVAREPI